MDPELPRENGPSPEVNAPDAVASTPVVQSPERAASPEKAAVARPSQWFFAAVAAASLAADVGSKVWAEIVLSARVAGDPLVLVPGTLSFELAYNPGGAFSLLRNQPELYRRPFFVIVSLVAVVFIVQMYRRTHRSQWALVWGLPLVLGGALGNFVDRIVRGSVVDFIVYQASWVEGMNRLIARLHGGWYVTNHWPTFNVADVAICIGVGLMVVDQLLTRRSHQDLPPSASAADSASRG